MKKILAIVTVSLAAVCAQAQQDPHFTQFFDNTLFVNPAYAGSKDVLNVTAMHREQWVGFDGRPVTSTLSIHSPLKYRSIGLGLTVVNDINGPFRQTLFNGAFSYSLKFKNGSKLAMGVQAGVNMVAIGAAGLIVTNQNDPNLLANVRNAVNPNFGFGLYYHSDKFFAGISSPKLLQPSFDSIASNQQLRHYFANVGGVFDVSATWKLRPMAQVKVVPGAPMSLDLSVAGIYDERFYVGALYRLQAAAGAFLQYQITPQFRFGVAVDFGTQAIRNYNYGTYEAMLTYDFVFKKTGIRSPRFF